MPVPPDSEGYIAPVFPAFPFYATVTGFPTLRSYHGSMGQNLGQIPEGTNVLVTERDGTGEFDLWVRLKDAPTNDHPDGRDGWILATGIRFGFPVPPPPVTPPPVTPPPVTPPPADVTMLENTMGAQFIMLMRTVKAYFKA